MDIGSKPESNRWIFDLAQRFSQVEREMRASIAVLQNQVEGMEAGTTPGDGGDRIACVRVLRKQIDMCNKQADDCASWAEKFRSLFERAARRSAEHPPAP